MGSLRASRSSRGRRPPDALEATRVRTGRSARRRDRHRRLSRSPSRRARSRFPGRTAHRGPRCERSRGACRSGDTRGTRGDRRRSSRTMSLCVLDNRGGVIRSGHRDEHRPGHEQPLRVSRAFCGTTPCSFVTPLGDKTGHRSEWVCTGRPRRALRGTAVVSAPIDTLLEEGAAALHEGDGAGARRAFDLAAATGPNGVARASAARRTSSTTFPAASRAGSARTVTPTSSLQPSRILARASCTTTEPKRGCCSSTRRSRRWRAATSTTSSSSRRSSASCSRRANTPTMSFVQINGFASATTSPRDDPCRQCRPTAGRTTAGSSPRLDGGPRPTPHSPRPSGSGASATGRCAPAHSCGSRSYGSGRVASRRRSSFSRDSTPMSRRRDRSLRSTSPVAMPCSRATSSNERCVNSIR